MTCVSNLGMSLGRFLFLATRITLYICIDFAQKDCRDSPIVGLINLIDILTKRVKEKIPHL